MQAHCLRQRVLHRCHRPASNPAPPRCHACSLAQLDALPPNNAMDNIVDAMAAAAEDYGVPGAVMVMVVQPGERNAYDQQVGGRRAGREEGWLSAALASGQEKAEGGRKERWTAAVSCGQEQRAL